MIDKVNLKGTNHYIEDNDDDGLRGTGVKVRRVHNQRYNILCFYTDRYHSPGNDTFNTFETMTMTDNYYGQMPGSPISTPSDWFYRNSFTGWFLTGEGVDSNGYIEVTSSQGTVGEYNCEVTKDCYLQFIPFWAILNDSDGYVHDTFVHPQWKITTDHDVYFAGISKAGYETINNTSLHFVADTACPTSFGEYMPSDKYNSIKWKISQGTTFQTNHSISTIKPYQIISGLTYSEVPNPVDLIGD